MSKYHLSSKFTILIPFHDFNMFKKIIWPNNKLEILSSTFFLLPTKWKKKWKSFLCCCSWRFRRDMFQLLSRYYTYSTWLDALKQFEFEWGRKKQQKAAESREKSWKLHKSLELVSNYMIFLLVISERVSWSEFELRWDAMRNSEILSKA